MTEEPKEPKKDRSDGGKPIRARTRPKKIGPPPDEIVDLLIKQEELLQLFTLNCKSRGLVNQEIINLWKKIVPSINMDPVELNMQLRRQYFEKLVASNRAALGYDKHAIMQAIDDNLKKLDVDED